MPLNNFSHNYRPSPTPQQPQVPQPQQPSVPGRVDNDNKDSVVSLKNNRFHLDESVMIVYNPTKDDLEIKARTGGVQTISPSVNLVASKADVDPNKEGVYYKRVADKVEEVYVVKDGVIYTLSIPTTDNNTPQPVPTPTPQPTEKKEVELITSESQVILADTGDKVYFLLDAVSHSIKKIIAVLGGHRFDHTITAPEPPKETVFIVNSKDEIDRAKDGTYYVKNEQGDLTEIYVVKNTQLITFKPSTITNQRIGTWSI
jgi:hypothetical protein